MLLRPTTETVGLTEEQLEQLKASNVQRERIRGLISYSGTALIGICFAVWVLFPLNTEGVYVRLATVAFLGLIGCVFIAGTLYAVAGLVLPRPDDYGKVEAFNKAVITFERDWREQYWKAFWHSVSQLAYHVEPETDLPKQRLGFLEHWRTPHVSCFFVLNGKHQLLYAVPQDKPFDVEAARKAVNTLQFYSADVMCLISPNGFAQDATEYFAKDHPKQFMLQIGQEASKTASWLRTLKPTTPGIPLDIIVKSGELSKLLEDWKAAAP
jgi:hypothetical protein